MKAAVNPRAILEVGQLHAGYEKHRVLIDVNLTVARGEWVALLGPNASGKTTLLHCVVGLMKASAGTISVAGRLGYATAPERLPSLLTGRQCLEIYAAAQGLPSIGAEVLALAERFQYMVMLDRFVESYSLGTKQKLAVLLGLLGEPELIVLDEAFNGLDPASSLALKHFLRERVSEGKCSVLLATHALDIVERYADRAALLLNGKIAREWSREELNLLKDGALETALAAAS